MPAYLLYSPSNTYDGSSGRNAVIAVGATEAAARTAANAAAPDGGTSVPAGWTALLLATTEHADLIAAGVVWLDRARRPLRLDRP